MLFSLRSAAARAAFQHRAFSAAPAIPALSQQFHDAVKLVHPAVQALKKDTTTAVQKVTPAMILGGMRGIQAMLTETSSLDAVEGIRYRHLSLSEANEQLPKAPGSEVGLPEAAFWLLLTGRVPSASETADISAVLRDRAALPDHVEEVIDASAKSGKMHPMTLLSTGLLALQTESEFHRQYSAGTLRKGAYADVMLDDSLTMLARLPTLAARVYRTTIARDFSRVDLTALKTQDWAGRYAEMLKIDTSGRDAQFKDVMRQYLMLHADHEGGNVSSHTAHLTGSALCDPFYAWAAGNIGLAGPLHGLANQQCLAWLQDTHKQLGTDSPTNAQVADFVQATLASGQVIPGFGHAVLRATDPRYTLQFDFAKKHLPNDPIFKLAEKCLEVVPPILQGTGKVANPWPNVDALSGTLMSHYGLSHANYFTVTFSVSRALGVCSQLCWSRALGMPIERPKSVNIGVLQAAVLKQK